MVQSCQTFGRLFPGGGGSGGNANGGGGHAVDIDAVIEEDCKSDLDGDIGDPDLDGAGALLDLGIPDNNTTDASKSTAASRVKDEEPTAGMARWMRHQFVGLIGGWNWCNFFFCTPVASYRERRKHPIVGGQDTPTTPTPTPMSNKQQKAAAMTTIASPPLSALTKRQKRYPPNRNYLRINNYLCRFLIYLRTQ